jgi:glutamyl-tRNA reductase
VARNVDRRKREIPRAEAIVQEELTRFGRWVDSLQITPTIKLLQRRFEQLKQAELERYGKRFADGDGEQLDQFTQGLCSKIVHHPIAYLRSLSQTGSAGDQMAAAEAIRRMFDLDALEGDA